MGKIIPAIYLAGALLLGTHSIKNLNVSYNHYQSYEQSSLPRATINFFGEKEKTEHNHVANSLSYGSVGILEAIVAGFLLTGIIKRFRKD